MSGNGFECPTCHKTFKSNQGLKVHIKRKHTPKEVKPGKIRMTPYGNKARNKKPFRKRPKDDE